MPKGTKAEPFELPNIKEPQAGVDIISEFPMPLRKRMNADIIHSILITPHIHNKLVTNQEGEYIISPDKAVRGAYDTFLKELTQKYGIDERFKHGPRVLDHYLKAQLTTGDEYLFGLVKNDLTTKILVLPRDEILHIDDVYCMGRHTHREFLFGVDHASLIAAGTLVVNVHGLQFNFRTGHFNVHWEDAQKLARIRRMMTEIVSFATDKTLPNHHPTFPQMSKFAMEYEPEHKPTHSVWDELPTPHTPIHSFIVKV